MNKSITKSFIFGSIIIFIANIIYVLSNVPPDGRWVVEVPVTSTLTIAYISILYFITKRITLESNKQFLIIILNVIASYVLIVFGHRIAMIFQDVNVLYINQYIPAAPYIIIKILKMRTKK